MPFPLLSINFESIRLDGNPNKFDAALEQERRSHSLMAFMALSISLATERCTYEER